MKNMFYTYIESVKKKWNTLSNSNTNYRREMKLVPISVDYCLLQFHTLKFYLGVHLHRGLALTSINFFSAIPPNFDNEIVKFTTHITWIEILITFLKLYWELLNEGIRINARFLLEFFLLNSIGVEEGNQPHSKYLRR